MGIDALVGKEDPQWFKRAHIGKFLAINDINTSLNGLEKWETLTRHQISLDQKSSYTKRISFYLSMILFTQS